MSQREIDALRREIKVLEALVNNVWMKLQRQEVKIKHMEERLENATNKTYKI